jgi:hypothetical protein
MGESLYRRYGNISEEKDMLDVYKDICADLKLDIQLMNKQFAKGGLKITAGNLTRFCQLNFLKLEYDFPNDIFSIFYMSEDEEEEVVKEKIPEKVIPKDPISKDYDDPF